MKPINGQRIECFDDDARCPGLLIRVNANGTKTWSLLYRTKVGNTLRRYTIGRFPEISLAKARALAIDALADVRAGDDPASGRRADREAMLFPALVKDFLATKRQKRSVGEDRTSAETRFPSSTAGNAKRFVKSAPRIFSSSSKKIARTAPIAANRTLAVLLSCFGHAVAPLKEIADNPCRLVKRPGEETKRERVLTDNEIRALWAVCEAAKATLRTDDENRKRPAVVAPVARLLDKCCWSPYSGPARRRG